MQSGRKHRHRYFQFPPRITSGLQQHPLQFVDVCRTTRQSANTDRRYRQRPPECDAQFNRRNHPRDNGSRCALRQQPCAFCSPDAIREEAPSSMFSTPAPDCIRATRPRLSQRRVGMKDQPGVLTQRMEPDLQPLLLRDIDFDGIAGEESRCADGVVRDTV